MRIERTHCPPLTRRVVENVPAFPPRPKRFTPTLRPFPPFDTLCSPLTPHTPVVVECEGCKAFHLVPAFGPLSPHRLLPWIALVQFPADGRCIPTGPASRAESPRAIYRRRSPYHEIAGMTGAALSTPEEHAILYSLWFMPAEDCFVPSPSALSDLKSGLLR